ncbi:hypothetical protein GCK32_021098, partial [Trichostrongylus colubriformis]
EVVQLGEQRRSFFAGVIHLQRLPHPQQCFPPLPFQSQLLDSGQAKREIPT